MRKTRTLSKKTSHRSDLSTRVKLSKYPDGLSSMYVYAYFLPRYDRCENTIASIVKRYPNRSSWKITLSTYVRFSDRATSSHTRQGPRRVDRSIPTVYVEFGSGFPLWTLHLCVFTPITTVGSTAATVPLATRRYWYSCQQFEQCSRGTQS